MPGRVVSRIVRSVGRSRPRRTIVGMTVVLALVLPAAANAGSSSAAASSGGFATVRLLEPSQNVQVGRIPGEPVYADPGVYLASRGGPWQVNIHRPNYGSTIVASQVAGGGNRPSAAVRELP